MTLNLRDSTPGLRWWIFLVIFATFLDYTAATICPSCNRDFCSLGRHYWRCNNRMTSQAYPTNSGKGEAMTRFPLNLAVVVGQTVTFNCRTESNNSVLWKYKAVGSKVDSVLSNSKEYKCDSCTVINTEPGQNDLQITNTKLSDAGTYTCVDNKDTDAKSVGLAKAESHSAELVVLATVPECGSNLTGSNASLLENITYVRMWCRVEFRGSIAPTMKWQNEATDEVIPSVVTTHQNRQVESEIIIQLKHDDNRVDIAYSSTTYFNQSFYDSDATSYSVAKNMPDYTYNWTTLTKSSAYGSTSSQSPSTERFYPSHDHGSFRDSTTTTTTVTVFVILLLLMILIVCIIFLKLSSKGISNIFYEDPHAGATSPINGEGINHAIQTYYEDPEQILDQSSPDVRENSTVQFRQTPDGMALSSATERQDHVYSLEPAQRSTRHQQVRLQNEAPSVITGSLTHALDSVGGGGLGSYEDVVDILRNINQSEERHTAAVNDGVHTHTPAFNVGTDGTIYTQVQLGRGRGGSMSPTTPQPRTIQPLFSTSVYAPIDHTTRIVPLPPTTRRH